MIKKDNFKQNKKNNKSQNKEKGRKAEEIAKEFLINNKINILEKNYFTRFGEIDLIGIKNKVIIFIEVKYRQNNTFGHGSDAISWRKKKTMKDSALTYLADNNINYNEMRFDLVEIKKNQIDINEKIAIKWTKNILQFDENW
ncbi:MAG: YraN family protein [Spirochaetes bacterium]|nr:YraN family protein [Spirochaetota bacterium]